MGQWHQRDFTDNYDTRACTSRDDTANHDCSDGDTAGCDNTDTGADYDAASRHSLPTAGHGHGNDHAGNDFRNGDHPHVPDRERVTRHGMLDQ